MGPPSGPVTRGCSGGACCSLASGIRPLSGPETGSRSGYAGLESTASGDEYGLSKRRLTASERVPKKRLRFVPHPRRRVLWRHGMGQWLRNEKTDSDRGTGSPPPVGFLAEVRE